MLFRALLVALFVLPVPALAQLRWVEGTHYIKLPSPVTAETRPGKVEVAEVFSYGCIHCFRAREEITKLQAALPPDAYLSLVHAAFNPAEAWPMFQRAWYAAQAMGAGTRVHERMFSAVWETREVPLLDAAGNVRKPLPTLQDAARFYARAAGVKEADFLKTANGAAVDAQMKRADALIKAWRIPGTPSLVVNGRYLVQNDSVSTWNDIRAIVLFLVGQERQRMASARPQASATPQPAVKSQPAARPPGTTSNAR